MTSLVTDQEKLSAAEKKKFSRDQDRSDIDGVITWATAPGRKLPKTSIITHTSFSTIDKRQVFYARDRLKIVRNKAWATTTVAPESVRSLTTKGQMEPTFKVSLTAFESYSAWHAACHQVTWQCWHCVGISPDLYSESPDTESDYHMESA